MTNNPFLMFASIMNLALGAIDKLIDFSFGFLVYCAVYFLDSDSNSIGAVKDA